MRVLAAAAQAVVLLGEVRELEVEAEGSQDERLLARRSGEVVVLAVVLSARASRASRRICLDEVEQPLAFLFDEHRAEDRPEHAHVAAERGGVVAARLDMVTAALGAQAEGGQDGVGVRFDRRQRATSLSTGCGRAPVTTSTTRDAGLDLAARDRFDERAERGAARAVGFDARRLAE